MKEIEAKILHIDPDAIIKKIEALGGQKIFEGILVDQSFDNKQQQLGKAQQLLRLRKTPTQTIVTYKKNTSIQNNIRSSDEYEMSISDADTFVFILESLGYQVKKYKEKKRISYQLNNVRIEIDTYPTIPAYMEIEGQQKDILDLVKQLGFSPKDLNAWTASEVLRSYGEDPSNQRFN